MNEYILSQFALFVFNSAYDHEHGSAAPILMGYKPKYGYTAWKNNRQNEAHEGFKSFVMKKGDYMIYYEVHSQSSNMSRIKTRFHTITMVFMHAKTGEKMMEVTHKADFGYLGARDRVKTKNIVHPLRAEDKRIARAQRGKHRAFRALNIVDVNNLDYRYELRPNPGNGGYEGWATRPMCTGGRYFVNVITDIERPSTGLKSDTDFTTRVKLGRTFRGKFVQNTGMSRSIRFSKNTIVGASSCVFEGGKKPQGYFYTDVYGLKVVKGPGPNAVRQYIKKDFETTYSFALETADQWLGLYQEGDKGFFKDSGFGIDANRN